MEEKWRNESHNGRADISDVQLSASHTNRGNNTYVLSEINDMSLISLPRLHSKLPSEKALSNYYSIETADSLSGQTEDYSGQYINYGFETTHDDTELSFTKRHHRSLSRGRAFESTETESTEGNGIIIAPRVLRNHNVDCTSSITSTTMSDVGTLARSSTNLTGPKKKKKKKFKARCGSWLPSVEATLATLALAGGLGNMARLPQQCLQHGHGAFLVAYLVLICIFGLPLAFLELAIGQFCQQGVTKMWRAVPLFRGVGYIKVFASGVLCIYYPLYMGMSLFYLTWLTKGPPPFTECSDVRMAKDGYETVGRPGQDCLKQTFLRSLTDDPMWYGVYVTFLFFLWAFILLCIFRRAKSLRKSIYFFVLPIVAVVIGLVVIAVRRKYSGGINGLRFLVFDWNLLLQPNVWYYALIQLFFSTHIGFGDLVTGAGQIYSKNDAFWTSLSYIFSNITLGLLSVLLTYSLGGAVYSQSDHSKKDNIPEVQLLTLIYDTGTTKPDVNTQIWMSVTYFIFVCAGFISVTSLLYTVVKAVTIEMRQVGSWCRVSAFLSIFGLIVGAFVLAYPDFQMYHILDYYVVGNIILISVILELIGFVFIYGCKNIYIDIEFILGHSLSILWKLFWYSSPILMLALSIWALSVMPFDESNTDPLWMYATGWSIVGVCVVAVIFIGMKQVWTQVDYNLCQKFSSSVKSSRNWGPVDPIFRYGWIQWRTKAYSGTKDFSLKRRGTRDFTNTIRRDANGHPNFTLSEMSTLPRSSPSYEIALVGESLTTNSELSHGHKENQTMKFDTYGSLSNSQNQFKFHHMPLRYNNSNGKSKTDFRSYENIENNVDEIAQRYGAAPSDYENFGTAQTNENNVFFTKNPLNGIHKTNQEVHEHIYNGRNSEMDTNEEYYIKTDVRNLRDSTKSKNWKYTATIPDTHKNKRHAIINESYKPIDVSPVKNPIFMPSSEDELEILTPKTYTQNMHNTYGSAIRKHSNSRREYNRNSLSYNSSEGYGTIGKGPYIIGGDDPVISSHVCWRRTSSFEEATEL